MDFLKFLLNKLQAVGLIPTLREHLREIGTGSEKGSISTLTKELKCSLTSKRIVYRINAEVQLLKETYVKADLASNRVRQVQVDKLLPQDVDELRSHVVDL